MKFLVVTPPSIYHNTRSASSNLMAELIIDDTHNGLPLVTIHHTEVLNCSSLQDIVRH